MKNLYANFTSMLKCLPVMLGIVFSATQTVQAGGNSVTETNAKLAYNMSKYLSKRIVVGGDFSIDFVAAAPYTYNHTTGGGAFDDRTIGKNQDVVESLEGGDFTCGDLVTYLTKVTVAAGATGTQTIELDYSFLAAATGQRGVALEDIVYVGINYDPIPNADGTGFSGDGLGGIDSGMSDDGGSTAALSNEQVNGTLFVKPATLTGTVTVTDLEAGEVVIVRVDVRIGCEFPSSPTGNLQASLPAARVIAPVFTGKNRTISVGQQTIPFKNVNLIQQASCTLNNITSACIDEVKTFTITRIPPGMAGTIYTWSFSNNTAGATFVQSDGSPLLTPNAPGNVATVYVKASSSGSYTVSVVASQAGFANATCSQLVTVNAALAEPDDEYVAPLCDSDKFSVIVNNPIPNATYSILDKCGNAISGVMVGSTTTSSYTPTTTADFTFSNIPAGSGYQITATKDNCSSPTASCGTCPNPVRQAVPASKPIIGKVESKDMIAYPVPFSESVTVEFKATKAENYVINLYDLQGHLVRELKAGNAKTGEVIKVQVSGAGMSESMYLVRKVSKSGISTVKLLKKD